MMGQDKICQSCGMPMSKETDFGTNSDGSRNGEYCHFCFDNGGFKDPSLTMDKQIEKMVGMASTMGLSQAEARKMARLTLPTLKRWQ